MPDAAPPPPPPTVLAASTPIDTPLPAQATTTSTAPTPAHAPAPAPMPSVAISAARDPAPAAVLPTLVPAPVPHSVAAPDITAHAVDPHPPASPAPPAEQIASATGLLARQNQGTAHLVLRLNPTELGQVQVTVSQPATGPTTVSLLVSRPETLALLLRDQPQLHQALGNAGINADPGHVSIQLGTRIPDAPPPAATGDSTSQQHSQQQPQGWSADFTASQGDGRHPDHGRPTGFAASALQADSAPTAAPAATPVAQWLRDGIDITA